MLFFIFLGVAVGSTILAFIAFNADLFTFLSETEDIAIHTSAISWIVTAIMIVTIAFNHMGVDARIEADKQIYDSLVYQAENGFYDNDNDIGKKELANQIQDWNSDLAKNKALQRNFWIGVFVPNIFDEYEYIPFDILE